MGFELRRFLGIAARHGKPIIMTANERTMANYRWRGIPKGPALQLPDYANAIDAANRYNKRYAVYSNPVDTVT